MFLFQLMLCLMITVYTSPTERPTPLVLQPPYDSFRRQWITIKKYFGPKRTDNYNPNYGYEPYWFGGDWVFDRFGKYKHPNGTICGEECPEMYKLFGMLCARSKTDDRKQFATYCDLLSENCTKKMKWMIIYRGECRDLKLSPTAHLPILDRVKDYEDKYDKAKITHHE